MSITARPSATFTAILTGAPNALGSTLTAGIRELPSGTMVSAAASTGIVETDVGATSNYVATRTAPADATANYEVVWLISGVENATEDLHVSTSAPVDGSTGALTDLASVREFLQKNGTETTQDDVIESLIQRASAEMVLNAMREFAPATDALTRSFRYDGRGYLDFKRWDLRTATLVQTSADGTSPTTITAPAYYELDPYDAPDGVYTGMFLGRSASRQIVSITGDWGFAEVPPNVQHWCNVTVSEWLSRDVARFSTTFDVTEDRVDRPEALPSAVRRGLGHYRRVLVP